MTIYIEVFLLQNFLINLSLLRLVNISLRPKSNFFRLSISSLVGAGFSVIGAMFISNVIVLNIIKVLCSIAMILIAFKQSKRQFILSILLLYAFTYALGGAIMNLTSSNYYTNFGAVSISRVPLELICSIAIVITYIYEILARHIRTKIKLNSFIYHITLYHKNKKLDLNAFLDTGNILQYHDSPVLVVDLKSYLDLMDIDFMKYFSSSGDTVRANTINGAKDIKVFKIDRIDIKTKHEKKTFSDQYIAVSTRGFNNANYQALLSPLML